MICFQTNIILTIILSQHNWLKHRNWPWLVLCMNWAEVVSRMNIWLVLCMNWDGIMPCALTSTPCRFGCVCKIFTQYSFWRVILQLQFWVIACSPQCCKSLGWAFTCCHLLCSSKMSWNKTLLQGKFRHAILEKKIIK